MTGKVQAALIAVLLFLSVALLCPAQCQTYVAQREDSPYARQHYQQAMSAISHGDYARAIEQLKRSIGYDPNNKNAQHYLGLCYMETGNNPEAEGYFRTALNIDSNFVECLYNYGVLLRRMGRLSEASSSFLRCIEINPKYPPPYYQLGQLLKEKGDLDGAIDRFETATRLKPNFYDAQRDLGLAIFERAGIGDNNAALDKLLTCARLVPDNPMVHFYLGTIYCADGKLDDAEKEFRTVLAIDPRHAAAHFELGKLRYYRGDLDRCLLEVKESEKISPSYSEMKQYPKIDPVITKRIIARCMEFKGKRIESVDAWRQAASVTKDNQVILKHIADLEMQLRKEAKQKKSKKQPIIVFDPAEVDAVVAQGLSQFEDNNLQAARQSFNKALELNPASFEAMQNLGFTLEAAGDLNGALEKYQAASTLNPQYDGAYYNLAFTLEKTGLPAEAGMMYQRFHELAGKYPYDPKHIVALQQADARERARQQQTLKRGY